MLLLGGSSDSTRFSLEDLRLTVTGAGAPNNPIAPSLADLRRTPSLQYEAILRGRQPHRTFAARTGFARNDGDFVVRTITPRRAFTKLRPDQIQPPFISSASVAQLGAGRGFKLGGGEPLYRRAEAMLPMSGSRHRNDSKLFRLWGRKPRRRP